MSRARVGISSFLSLCLAASCGSEPASLDPASRGGGDDAGADDAGAAADASTDGSSGSDGIGLTTCDESGTQFELRHSDPTGFAVTEDAAVLQRGSDGTIVGVRGTTETGTYWLDWITSDGAGISDPGTYELSGSKHRVQYVGCASQPSKETCLAGNAPYGRSHTFSAYAGTIVVDEVSPTFRARFALRSLKEGLLADEGAAVSGSYAGCAAIAN